ncbi:transposase [Nocardia nova]|uniref:transposase n=1 Tax=Nocardia nova TaxID=37330 RepID=UPI001E4803B6|nr:transposase [Nocardia nova]
MVTAGQAGDSPQFTAVLDAIVVPKLGGGRARVRPERVLADKAYSGRGNREWLRRHGIRAAIPSLPTSPSTGGGGVVAVAGPRHSMRRSTGIRGGRPPRRANQFAWFPTHIATRWPVWGSCVPGKVIAVIGSPRWAGGVMS